MGGELGQAPKAKLGGRGPRGNYARPPGADAEFAARRKAEAMAKVAQCVALPRESPFCRSAHISPPPPRREVRHDAAFGFAELPPGEATLGWLSNMAPTAAYAGADAGAARGDGESPPPATGEGAAAVAMYFIRQDGSSFRCTIPLQPCVGGGAAV